MTVVLKLGGSVLTEKAETEVVDEAALRRAAEAVGERPPDATDLVVVHGGGSFGHPAASRHGVSASTGTTDPEAIHEVHAAMGRLNDRVIAALQAAGVPALPVRPLSAAARDAEGAVSLGLEAVRAMLAEGFVPVLHGDVVVQAGAGATVLGGDDLVVALARGLDADRAGLCSTVPGVLDDGTVIPEIERWDAVADVLGGSDATDVTGGMAGKVRALLDLSVPADVFGLEDLPAFLDGERVGTRIGA